MNDLQDWSCNFTLDTDTAITVGQPFGILCKGTSALAASDEIVLFPNNDDVKYDFVIIRTKHKSDYELFISATSWKVGNHNLKDYQLAIGESVLALNGPEIYVKTVLEKGTKTNLPGVPGLDKIPKSYFYFLGALGVFILAYLVFVYKKSRKYDKGLLKLHALRSSQPAYYQFQKEIRILKIKAEKVEPNKQTLLDIVLNFEKSFLNYLSLELNEPFFIYNKNQIAKEILKKTRVKDLSENYKSLTKEILKLREDIQNKSVTNLESFYQDLLVIFEESIDFSASINKKIKGGS